MWRVCTTTDHNSSPISFALHLRSDRYLRPQLPIVCANLEWMYKKEEPSLLVWAHRGRGDRLGCYKAMASRTVCHNWQPFATNSFPQPLLGSAKDNSSFGREVLDKWAVSSPFCQSLPRKIELLAQGSFPVDTHHDWSKNLGYICDTATRRGFGSSVTPAGGII